MRKSQYELEILGQIEKLKEKIESLQGSAKLMDETIVIEQQKLNMLTNIHKSASGVRVKEGKK